MRPGLSLRMSQHLALTPQLQQSIRLLQLSTLELSQEVDQMLDDNPFLERAEEEAPAEAFGLEQADSYVSLGDRVSESASRFEPRELHLHPVILRPPAVGIGDAQRAILQGHPPEAVALHHGKLRHAQREEPCRVHPRPIGPGAIGLRHRGAGVDQHLMV